jgi:hypothetical protein
VKRFAEPEERADVASRIDPKTAHVFFVYGPLDPDGECFGRIYHVVDPEEGVAVWIGDLPESKRHDLRGKQTAANREGWELVAGVARRPRKD